MTTGDLSMEWDLFKHDYNKQYSSLTEESERKEIFIENINRMKTYIKTHPDANYSMKINSLFDRRSEVRFLSYHMNEYTYLKKNV